MPVPQLPADFASYRRLFTVAGPLVLAQMCLMAMQFTDRLVLARYSESSIAAIGSAFLLFLTFAGVFIGVTGYTSTFVAHYIGANRPDRVGPTIWQGFYLSLIGSLPVMLAPLIAYPIFHWFGHEPDLIREEMIYLTIHCLGAPLFLLVSALTGFFSGRNDNLRVMAAQFVGLAMNLVLCLILVPGNQTLHIPEMGIAGASLATVIAQLAILIPLCFMFFTKDMRTQFNTWNGRSLDIRLLRRIFAFGFPSGMRFSADLLVWSSFFLFIGGLGKPESAASNIVHALNTFAFFPLAGIMMAVSVLVGQAQGAMRSDLAEKVGWRGLFIGQAWMLTWALIFVLFPDFLIAFFHNENSKISPEEFAHLSEMCKVLLRFVAIYCIVDGVNLIVLGALQGAGDTKWTLWVSMGLHAVFFTVMIILTKYHMGLNTLWAVATGFIFILAITWLIRFKSGAWKRIQVIEQSIDEEVTPKSN
jgi:multidrug resistance protein, MATE family